MIGAADHGKELLLVFPAGVGKSFDD